MYHSTKYFRWSVFLCNLRTGLINFVLFLIMCLCSISKHSKVLYWNWSFHKHVLISQVTVLSVITKCRKHVCNDILRDCCTSFTGRNEFDSLGSWSDRACYLPCNNQLARRIKNMQFKYCNWADKRTNHGAWRLTIICSHTHTLLQIANNNWNTKKTTVVIMQVPLHHHKTF